MKINCPKCNKLLSTPNNLAGKVVRCPCGQTLKTKAIQQTSSGISGTPKPSSVTTPPPIPSGLLFDELPAPATQDVVKPFPTPQFLKAHVEPLPDNEAPASTYKNPSHLGEAVAQAAENEKKQQFERQNQRSNLKIQIVAGVLVTIIGVVGFLISYSGSKPLKLQSQANTAFNKIIIAAHACNALEGNNSNFAKSMRQKYISNARIAAQELQVILQMMEPEDRKKWDEYQLKKLGEAVIKNPSLFGL